SESQKLHFAVDTTSGQFTLTYNGTLVSQPITFAATGAATATNIQSALNTMFNLGNVVSVTPQGAGNTDYLITFQGALANANVTQLFASSTTLNGGVTPPAPQVQVSPFLDGAGNTAEQLTFTGTGSTRFSFNGVANPGVTVNEVQTITN